MPTAKKKKTTQFQNEMTKSVFLIGNPNVNKFDALKKLQTEYTNAVNHFIELLNEHKELFLQIVKNDCRDSAMRAFEKANRFVTLGSAYSQTAFDNAVTLLSNRANDIRTDLIREHYDVFVSSKVAFAYIIMGKSKDEIANAFEAIANTYSDQEYRDKYFALRDKVNAVSNEAFEFRVAEILDSYAMLSPIYQVPRVKQAWVKADSRVWTFEPSSGITSPFVACVSIPWERGRRIEVPLDCSSDALRRLAQYGNASSMTFTITSKGQLRVALAFKKKLKTPNATTVLGIDTGIKDCFYLSDGKHFGTMDKLLDYYKKVVEPSQAGLSDLRNKKRKILHFLKTHPGVPADVRLKLLAKGNNLEAMIRKAKEPQHKLRAYYALLNHEVASSVKSVLSDVRKDQLIAIEKLDIKEFNKSRKANGKLSTFSRGLLQKKLMEELNWHGFNFVEVEPDYTSQLCPVCFNLDKDNRNEKSFRCTCCGHEDDADHNASVNIRNRATDNEILTICENYSYRHKQMQNNMKELYSARHDTWLANTNTEGKVTATSAA